MKMKFMRMQMLRPWALQCLMGDGVTPVGAAVGGGRVHHQVTATKTTMTTTADTRCKLFKPDGQVCIYNSPIQASVLMAEFPKHLVCRSDSFYIGQKVVPLSENDHLQLGHTYFLLPTQFFQSTLTFVTIASFASSSPPSSSSSSSPSSKMELANKADDARNKAAFLKKAAASTCPPFDMQKTAAGALTIRVSGEFISQLMVDRWSSAQLNQAADDHGVDRQSILLCTTPQLQKDYKQLVIGSRGHWKPKLEMIKEAKNKSGKKAAVFLSAASFKFGIQRLKKRLGNNNNNNDKKKKKKLKKSHESQPQSCTSSATTSPRAHALVTTKKKKKKTSPNLKKKRKPSTSSSNNSDSDHHNSAASSKQQYSKNSKSAAAPPAPEEAPSSIIHRKSNYKDEDQASSSTNSSTTSTASSKVDVSRSVSPDHHNQQKGDDVNGDQMSTLSSAASNIVGDIETTASSPLENSKPAVGRNCCQHPAQYQPIVLQKSPSASPRVLEPKSSYPSTTTTSTACTKNSTAKSLSKKFRSFGGRSKPLL